MSLSRAILETSTARRYITRLCKHWGHRFAVDFNEQQGCIDFGDSSCELQASPTALHISLIAPVSKLEELESVVEEHLQRFAHRDQALHFTWERIPDLAIGETRRDHE